METNTLIHEGKPRRSGRYPWGSGKRPFQSLGGGSKGIISRKSSNANANSEADAAAKKEAERTARKERVAKSRSAKEVYDNADLFSDQELQRLYNRLQLERNIKNLAPQEKSRGEQYVDNLVKFGKKTSEVISTGSKLYNDVARVYNSLSENGRNNPWHLIDMNNNQGKKNKHR